MIKARSNDLVSSDYYLIAEEIIYDLNQMFAEVNREQRAEIELQNPKFVMSVKDFKETFLAFYARFIVEIASLSLFDSSKRSHLKRLITWRLRSRIINETVAINFSILVTRLRQLDIELRINDDTREAISRRGGTLAGTSGTSETSETSGGREGSTISGSHDPPRPSRSIIDSTEGSRYHLPEN